MKNKFFREISARDILRKHLGGICFYCGQSGNLDLHHKLPKYLGGADELNNIELVCQKCHLDLHKQWQKIFPYKSKKGKKNFKKFFDMWKNYQQITSE